MAAPALAPELLARLHLPPMESPSAGRSLGLAVLDAVLPDGGLPRGAVVELAGPRALGGATSIALAAIRAAQMDDPRVWAAWIDPEGSLYAPGVATAGVDLARLFVVRPPRVDLARVVVKVAAARAFDVVVVDMDAVPGSASSAPARSRKRGWPPEVLVRKLALLAEEGGATVILVTDAGSPRALPWPVALRLDVARVAPDALRVRVAKDKRGRIGLARTVPLRPLASAG